MQCLDNLKHIVTIYLFPKVNKNDYLVPKTAAHFLFKIILFLDNQQKYEYDIIRTNQEHIVLVV